MSAPVLLSLKQKRTLKFFIETVMMMVCYEIKVLKIKKMLNRRLVDRILYLYIMSLYAAHQI